MNRTSAPTRRPASVALCALMMLAVVLPLAAGDSKPEERSPTFQLHGPRGVPLEPPLPDPADFPEQLVLDDDTAESDFGLVGAESVPFLWLQRFSPPTPFVLEQMWVLFPQDPLLAGADVQLAVYQDADGDPTNGAQLLATQDVEVQEIDGVTFSIYDLEPPVDVTSGDAYLGVVSRYAESPTPPTFPATLDTGTSQGRSWVAVWTGPPPADPTLPGDDETFLIDTFVPGNWLIRGFGRSGATVLEIPTLGAGGLSVLACLLTLAAAGMLRRRLASEPALPRDEG